MGREMEQGSLVIGHRGMPVCLPENSLAGFRACRQAGFQAVEMDLHLDAEGEFWVLHDPVPGERHLPKGAGPADFPWWGRPVYQLTGAERRQLRAVDRPSGRPQCGGGEPIPSFRELLAEFGSAVGDGGETEGSENEGNGQLLQSAPALWVVEIKSDPLDPESPTPETVAAAFLLHWRQAPAGICIAVKSFDWRVLDALEEAGRGEGPRCGALVARPRDERDRPEPGNLYPGSPWLGRAGERLAKGSAGGDGEKAGARGGSVAWGKDGGALGRISDEALVAVAAARGWSFLSVRADEDCGALVSVAHPAGIAVWAWTVDDPEEARALASKGVDGLISDDPVAIREALAGGVGKAWVGAGGETSR